VIRILDHPRDLAFRDGRIVIYVELICGTVGANTRERRATVAEASQDCNTEHDRTNSEPSNPAGQLCI
jgi:hypothetical protein